jgi:hypothetical protein
MAPKDYGLVLAVRTTSSVKRALKEIARKRSGIVEDAQGHVSDWTLGDVIREALREKIEKESK